MKPPLRGMAGGDSGRPGDRTAGGNPAWGRASNAGCRGSGAVSGTLAHPGVAGEMHRHLARMRHEARWGGQGRIGMRRVLTGRHRAIRKRQRGSFARPSDDSRGTTGQSRVLDRSRRCRGDRGGRGGQGGILGVGGRKTPQPRRHRRRTRGRRPCRKTRRGRRRRRHGNCIEGPWQQCGFASSSSRDGGSPSKTDLARRPGPLTRRRARQLPSVTR